MLPAVPLAKFTRSEPRAGRRFDKPAPRSTPCGRDRVSRFEPNWYASSAHKLGSLPRLCWPPHSCARPAHAGGPGLSRSFRRGAGSLGQVAARFRDDPRATTFATASVFLPLEIPTGLSKRNNFRSPSVCRDAQRRADALQKTGRKQHKIRMANHQMQERFHLERSPLARFGLRKAPVLYAI